jgi:hypothetical protein
MDQAALVGPVRRHSGKTVNMRRFSCPACGNTLHFDNSQCVNCSTLLGYSPVQNELVALMGDPSVPYATGQTACRNRETIGCNWLCDGTTGDDLCLSCQHTTKIPDISNDVNRERWAKLERAKRRLFYALSNFDLPLKSLSEDPDGFLHFELLGDEIRADGKPKRVMTGHNRGRITINIAEADDAIREANRTQLGEPYRTLIGHFRHEVGHFYWDQLIAGQNRNDAFRTCFGDERQDYGDALKAHYANGAPPDWQTSFVSSYASAHPWEDFAETWAHYFHMVGGLETAYSYGINPQPMTPGARALGQLENPYHVSEFDDLQEHWIPLTVAMNAMNRSMGIPDYYPFILSDRITEKLRFVHNLIQWQSAS